MNCIILINFRHLKRGNVTLENTWQPPLCEGATCTTRLHKHQLAFSYYKAVVFWKVLVFCLIFVCLFVCGLFVCLFLAGRVK